MNFPKLSLSDSATTHDVFYGQCRYIAYLDNGVWYHRVTTKGKREFVPFNDQSGIRSSVVK